MSYDDHTLLVVPLRVGCVRRGLRRSRQPAGSEPPEEEVGRLADTRPQAENGLPDGGASDGSGQEASGEPEAATDDPWMTPEGEPWEPADESAASDQAAPADESAEAAGSAESAGSVGATGSAESTGSAETTGAGEADSAPDTAELGAADTPTRTGSRLGRHSLAPVTTRTIRRSRDVARRATAPLARSGWGFTRLTLLSPLLVIAWLLPAIPLLLAGSFAVAPMLVISIPLALVLTIFGLRRVPARWPASAQARAGLGDRAPWWSVLGTLVVAGGFAAWQIVEKSQPLIVASDPGASLQFGYWIAQHGSASIPTSAAAFGGPHPGLSFASVGFVQHGGSLYPQFLAGLPSVLAAAFWAGGIHAALLVPGVLGALAVLTFAGLAGRLCGPRWAPAAAIILAVALPQQYTSRAPFGEPLLQILLFGGLCLLIDSLGAPARARGDGARWWRTGLNPGIVLAALGGLSLGLTAAVQVGGLVDVLPAIVVIGILFASGKPQWLPLGIGLVVGVGYGLANGYLLARPYLDGLASWMRTFGIIAAGVTAVTVAGVLLTRMGWVRRAARRALAARPLRWLPEAAAALVVLAAIGAAVRPYVQTVRADSGRSVIAYVGYLQRAAGLPLDPRRLYAEDTLYWVIWYIGLPAVLLAVFGLALLARRLLRALITWNDPFSVARMWTLPLLMIGWVTASVLWRPGTVPDQPWASRRLVPVVLPGLILVAVWAAAWLTGRAGKAGAGKAASSAVAMLCVGALLLPTALTTFGVGVSPTGPAQPRSPAAGLAFQRTGQGEFTAVNRLCSAIGPGASVVIVDPRVGDGFTQLIRGGCDVPAARMDRPTPLSVRQVIVGIRQARRRPVLLGSRQAQVAPFCVSREVVNLTTRQDAHELTRPPTATWPIRYTIWMAEP
jgi:hypothetical protein